MDQVYAVINSIQTNREGNSFKVEPINSSTVENILKDLSLQFSKIAKKKSVKYTISAPEENKSFHMLDEIESLGDEIPEDDQIVFD